MADHRYGRRSQSRESMSLGDADPRRRRNAASGVTQSSLAAPLTVDNDGRTTIALAGALYTGPDDKLAIQTSEGLTQAPGSPWSLQLAPGDDSLQFDKQKRALARPDFTQVRAKSDETVGLNLKDVLDREIELVKRKGLAGGYPSLDPTTGFVPATQLGSGTHTSTTVLRGDGTYGAAPVPANYSGSGTGDGMVADPGGSSSQRVFRDDGTFTSLGFSAGVGGTVSQLTNKSTAVVINKICGTITTNNAALAANTSVEFGVSNSSIGANDVVVLSVQSSGATTGAYMVSVDRVGASTFGINLRNVSAGSLSENVKINFLILKSVIS